MPRRVETFGDDYLNHVGPRQQNQSLNFGQWAGDNDDQRAMDHWKQTGEKASLFGEPIHNCPACMGQGDYHVPSGNDMVAPESDYQEYNPHWQLPHQHGAPHGNTSAPQALNQDAQWWKDQDQWAGHQGKTADKTAAAPFSEGEICPSCQRGEIQGGICNRCQEPYGGDMGRSEWAPEQIHPNPYYEEQNPKYWQLPHQHGAAVAGEICPNCQRDYLGPDSQCPTCGHYPREYAGHEGEDMGAAEQAHWEQDPGYQQHMFGATKMAEGISMPPEGGIQGIRQPDPIYNPNAAAALVENLGPQAKYDYEVATRNGIHPQQAVQQAQTRQNEIMQKEIEGQNFEGQTVPLETGGQATFSHHTAAMKGDEIGENPLTEIIDSPFVPDSVVEAARNLLS